MPHTFLGGQRDGGVGGSIVGFVVVVDAGGGGRCRFQYTYGSRKRTVEDSCKPDRVSGPVL